MAWSLSNSGYNFLKNREGVIHKPVWDRTNYAVGIGHNGPDVDPNHYYSDAEIKRLFDKDKKLIESAANRFPNIQNQAQFDALFSLCYNCGGGIASGGNRIYDAMRNNEHVNNQASFTKKWSNYRWNNGDLRSRRSAEINLFYSQPVNPANNSSEAVESVSDDDNADGNRSVYGNGSNQLSPEEAAAQGSQAQQSQEGLGSGVDPNNTANKGTAYPVIKINDSFISPHDIVEFYMETGWFRSPQEYISKGHLVTGFVPTMHLVVQTRSSQLLKGDTIKAGDKCNVFFRTGTSAIRSYRGDFVITKVMTDRKPSEVIE
jgi:GH24 family phage-related lysozyme (muramidase)